MRVELEALKKRLFKDNAVKNVKLFPGSNHDATPEDFARGVNMYFAEAENSTQDIDLKHDLDSDLDS